jgi:hypothetical protein
MPIFTLRPRRKTQSENCRGEAIELLSEVTRCLHHGVRHDMLITQAALIWRDAAHLEPTTLN